MQRVQGLFFSIVCVDWGVDRSLLLFRFLLLGRRDMSIVCMCAATLWLLDDS